MRKLFRKYFYSTIKSPSLKAWYLLTTPGQIFNFSIGLITIWVLAVDPCINPEPDSADEATEKYQKNVLLRLKIISFGYQGNNFL